MDMSCARANILSLHLSLIVGVVFANPFSRDSADSIRVFGGKQSFDGNHDTASVRALGDDGVELGFNPTDVLPLKDPTSDSQTSPSQDVVDPKLDYSQWAPVDVTIPSSDGTQDGLIASADCRADNGNTQKRNAPPDNACPVTSPFRKKPTSGTSGSSQPGRENYPLDFNLERINKNEDPCFDRKFADLVSCGGPVVEDASQYKFIYNCIPGKFQQKSENLSFKAHKGFTGSRTSIPRRTFFPRISNPVKFCCDVVVDMVSTRHPAMPPS